jgi:DNA-binding response OmpR family regulator
MTSTEQSGLAVLLVEDEVMIRMMVAEMLEELGHSIAGEAGEIEQAIQLAQNVEFDLAILDVNLKGEMIAPVAELIIALNRPFVFVTGYGSSGVPKEHRDRPALRKPFTLDELARVIDKISRSTSQKGGLLHPEASLCFRFCWASRRVITTRIADTSDKPIKPSRLQKASPSYGCHSGYREKMAARLNFVESGQWPPRSKTSGLMLALHPC